MKECLVKGFVNIGQDDIRDILEDIPEEIIKTSVRKSAEHIFEKSTEAYLQKVCQKLIDKIQEGDIKLSRDQTRHILELIKRSEQEAVQKMVERLPNNPFFGEIIAGMQTALEESLEKNFEAYEERIQQEIRSKS